MTGGPHKPLSLVRGYLAYEADGNVTGDGTNQYLSDEENRLCATQSDFTHAMTGYLYDGMSNRLAKGTLTSFSCDFTTNGFSETNVFVPGLQGEQLQEDDSSGNLLHLNVFLGGKVLWRPTPVRDTSRPTGIIR